MTIHQDTCRAVSLLGKRGAREGVARGPWLASGMGTDEPRNPSTNEPHHKPQRVVEKVGRSITNSETPHRGRGDGNEQGPTRASKPMTAGVEPRHDRSWKASIDGHSGQD